MKWYNIILALFLFLSCNGVNSNEPPEEEKEVLFLKERILLGELDYYQVEAPIIFDNKVIVLITNNDTNEGWIDCYDKNTFEKLWSWREALDEYGAPAKGFGQFSYLKNGILCIKQQNLSYGINADTGKTIWENREASGENSFKSGKSDYIGGLDFDGMWQDRYVAEAANIYDGVWKHYFTFNREDSLRVSGGAPHPFYWEGKNYMTFIASKWGTNPHLEISWLYLYNITDDHLVWKSDTIPLFHPLSGVPGKQPEFEDGQILLANDAIYSYNFEDGSLEWWKRYTNRFVFTTHLTTANGMVYGNNEDQFMVGLNIHTGEEIFKTDTGGSASRIVYNNGKCYMSSVTVGGSNRLMVIDGTTGAVLQSEKAPFRSEDSKWTFARATAVDPETEYVYTSDHRYLLVYDFGE